jgi:hypothetical protein
MCWWFMSPIDPLEMVQAFRLHQIEWLYYHCEAEQ